VIGDGSVLIAPRETGIGYLAQCRRAIAPFRVHLQIAAILVRPWPAECGFAQHTDDFSSAEEMAAERAPPFHIGGSVAECHCLIHAGGPAGLEHLENDARRCRTDACNLRQAAIRPHQIGQRGLEPQDDGSGALVAEHLLTILLHEGQIAQQPANDGVDIHALSLMAAHLSMSFAR
jgi:hypothetical protein